MSNIEKLMQLFNAEEYDLFFTLAKSTDIDFDKIDFISFFNFDYPFNFLEITINTKCGKITLGLDLCGKGSIENLNIIFLDNVTLKQRRNLVESFLNLLETTSGLKLDDRVSFVNKDITTIYNNYNTNNINEKLSLNDVLRALIKFYEV